MEFIGATIWLRKTIESDVFYHKPDKWFKIWFFLINKVNHKDTNLFERGKNFTTYQEIALYTKATKHQIDKFIRWAKEQSMLTTQKTTRGMVVNVINYPKYQDYIKTKRHTDDTGGETKTTDRRNKDDTINKNDKNVKNDKKGEDLSPSKKMKEFIKRYNEKKDFMDLLGDYWNEKVSTLDETQLKFFLDEVNKFCFYWIELNKSGTRQKWEMQKTFQVERRLVTWFNNIKKFSNNKTNNIQII